MIKHNDSTITYDSYSDVFDKSEWVRSAAYDAETMELYVVFQKDPTATWVYDKVPDNHFTDLVCDESPGSYYSTNIKGRYHSEYIDGYDLVWKEDLSPEDEPETFTSTFTSDSVVWEQPVVAQVGNASGPVVHHESDWNLLGSTPVYTFKIKGEMHALEADVKFDWSGVRLGRTSQEVVESVRGEASALEMVFTVREVVQYYD